MAAHQAPLSLGFSRQEHWNWLPFPSPMHESEKWKWSHSVDCLGPHGLQPTRLLHPWDFPCKSTGVGCHLPSLRTDNEMLNPTACCTVSELKKNFFLMWTISLKSLLNCFCFMFFFFFWLRGLWDPSFLTRDQTHTPCIGRWGLSHWTAREVLHHIRTPSGLPL